MPSQDPDATVWSEHLFDDIEIENVSGIRFPRQKPKAVLIDSEPSVCDVVRQGKYKDFFCKDDIISGMEGSANLYENGYRQVGLLDSSLSSILKIIERNGNLLNCTEHTSMLR